MRRQDWIELILLSVLWGATFFAAAVALADLPPLTLVLARVAIGALCLVPAVWLMGQRLPKGAALWAAFAVMAMLNNIIPFSLFFFGQQYIPSGLASVLNATTPLMSLLVARLVAGEAMPLNKIAGVVLGLAGVAVLIGPDVAHLGSMSAIGMLACLAATLSYGFSGLWGRRFKTIPPLTSAAAQITCSTAMLLPIAGAADRFWTLPLPGTKTILACLSLGIASTAVAYILFFRIMARAGSHNVMLVTLLIPVSAIALGVTLLGETLSLRQIAGAAIIGLSLLVIDGRLFGIPSAAPQPK